MKLGDYLRRDYVLPNLQAGSKAEVLSELIQPLAQEQPEVDADKARRVLMEREKLGTTGIGGGVAIPHGKIDELEDIILVAGRSSRGVEFDALDQQPCHIFFMVLAPENAAGQHLRILAHISRLLKDEDFRRSFLSAEDAGDLWELLHNA
ncbi:PTS sugar transporter subunit IIA [Desulfohalovibrio reitneri]|uniref:PTS sugar transporter subunit IIA n=1 Tax=Desulfohalovibrio reitneri TaxID=1307759 RepID=UPI0004A70770|nr:PTS sugar transporter subunit IIA [Desulfohalovibrio reitneri]